ncbi:MAG: cupin domain-containing protein [Solirubrobacterales bacterium]
MADVTVKRIEDFDSMSHEGLSMHTVRSGLGVSSFGIQVIRIPPGNDAYPEHDHSPQGIGGRMFEKRPGQLDQEEVYTVLEGTATLRAGGQEHELEPGVLARVGPGETRKIVTGAEGATLLALGGIPGKPFGQDN